MMRALIIEDEKPAQEVLQNYIDKTPFIECIGIHESGLNVTPEELSQADIMFLDIQLPEITGLSYLRTIANPPEVIVTTAYPDYAVNAFEVAVVDYLLKPFSYERFFKAVNRVRDQGKHEDKEIDKTFFLYADKTHYKMMASDMLYLKAEVDYVKVVSKEKSIVVLDSLRNWTEKLQDLNFVQVHRSYIVNLDKVQKVTGNRSYIDDQAIPLGKTYKSDFIDKLNGL